MELLLLLILLLLVLGVAVAVISRADPKATLPRMQFFLRTLGMCLASSALSGMIDAVSANSTGIAALISTLLLFGIALIVLGYQMLWMTYRLQDMAAPKWAALLIFLPLLNLIIFLVLFFWPGESATKAKRDSGQKTGGPEPHIDERGSQIPVE